jgi:membrane-associated phospholipid phosphatase
MFLLASAAAAALPARFSRGSMRWTGAYARFAWQLGALLGLEQAYEVTRGEIPHETDVAMMNAYRLLDFEWSHGFFIEERIQHFFLQFRDLMIGVDLFYIFGHLIVTVGVLTWIYICRRSTYPLARNLLMLVTAIALVVYYVYPTAPPRMLTNYGFVDPAVLNHLTPAGEDQPESYTYNPYAAMPSLHVAYAMVVAISVIAADRRLWLRILAALYPVSMAAVVIISGNHWLLDVAGACITVVASACLLAGLTIVTGWARALLGGASRATGAQTHELRAT